MVAAVPAYTRLILVLLPVLMAGDPTLAVETIRSTAVVRSMPPKEAVLGRPVEIRGMVTFAYPGDLRGNLIVEQEGVSIFVNIDANVVPRDASGRVIGNGRWPVIEVGTEVVVSGITGKGQYAPVVSAKELRILGIMPSPPPRPFVLSEVLTGSMDCQRLELRGVVQGAELSTLHNSMLRLELAVPAGRMVVECFSPGPWTRAKLLGATIRVTAVCLVYFNVRGESLGVHFMVGRSGDIVVEQPAPVDPFAVPQVPLNALQVFSPSGPNLERVQIVGQATLSRPGEYFYLEDGGRAVRVFTREKTRFEPGEWVVASGFIDLHQSFAELREAEVRRTGPGILSEPPLLTHKGLLSSSERKWGFPVPVDYNGRLITLRGSLAKIEPTDNGGRRLLLNTDGGSVAATLDDGGGAKSLDALLPGSGVQVTGVCELQFPSAQLLTDFPNPTGLSLQMRSPADLRILNSASWWTPKRLWILLGKEAPSTAAGSGYVEVRGLTIQGCAKEVEAKYKDKIGKPEPETNGNGISFSGRFETNKPHHLRIADCTIFDCPGGGISAMQTDRVSIENNHTYDNCHWMIYAGSGISVYQGFNFENSPVEYRMLVSNNRSHDNYCTQPWSATGKLSDGNGLIVDDMRNTQHAVQATNGIYHGRILIQGNLSYLNGGSGMHAFSSNHVDFINNTAYGNNLVMDYSQIGLTACTNCRVLNNIIVAPADKPINRVNGSSKEIVISHNLFWGGNVPPVSGKNPVTADPQFVNAAAGDFRLKPGSPALGAGGLWENLPATYQGGSSRDLARPPDLGALPSAP